MLLGCFSLLIFVVAVHGMATDMSNPMAVFFTGYSAGNVTLPPVTPPNNRVPPINALVDPKVAITVQLYLFSISEVDEAQEMFSIGAALILSWSCGSTGFQVPAAMYEVSIEDPTVAWTPKLAVRNMLNQDVWVNSLKYTPLDIYSPDWVYWRLYNTYELSCNYTLRFYPWDVSICRFSLMPLTEFLSVYFNVSKHHPICLRFYTENSQWNFLGNRNVQVSYTSNLQELVIEMVISRKPSFCVFTFLVPIALLSVTGACICLVPPDSDEKMGISMSIVLSFFVLFGSVSTSLPAASDWDKIPLLYWILFTFYMLTMMTAVYASVLLRLSHFIENSRSPKLFAFIEKLLNLKNKTKAANKVAPAPIVNNDDDDKGGEPNNKLAVEAGDGDENDEAEDGSTKKLAQLFIEWANRIGFWVYLVYLVIIFLVFIGLYKQGIDRFAVKPHPTSSDLFIVDNITFYKPVYEMNQCLYCTIDAAETALTCNYPHSSSSS